MGPATRAGCGARASRATCPAPGASAPPARCATTAARVGSGLALRRWRGRHRQGLDAIPTHRHVLPVRPGRSLLRRQMFYRYAWPTCQRLTTAGGVARGSRGQAPTPARRITIDPITRLEGHGKIDIFLDDAGRRGARLLPGARNCAASRSSPQGRPAEDMPQITSRICGVCPTAHHMAATKALDALYQVDPPPAAKKIRELVYSTFMVEDHALHFYFLGGPDFVVGPDAPAARAQHPRRHRRVGEEVGRQVITMRRGCAGDRRHGRRQGRSTRCSGLPGGVAKRVTARAAGGIQGDGRRRGRVRPLHPGHLRARSCSATRRTWT